LEQGEPAPYAGYLYSEPQYDNLLELKYNYEIGKKLWDTKEKIYLGAIKEAEKTMKRHWWQSSKFNFVLGMLTVVVAAYVVGQTK